MASKIQIKRGTTAQWASSTNDTTLAPGQLGVEYLTSGYSRLKVGTDDSTHSSTDWADLNYLTPSTQTYRDNMIAPVGAGGSVVSWSEETIIRFGNPNKIAYLIGGGSVALKTNTTGNIVAANNSFFSSASDVSLGKATSPWTRLHLSNAASSEISQDANGLYFGTGRYPSITRYSSNLIFNPSGGLSTGGQLTLSTTALYPSVNGKTDLGTSSYQFGSIHIQDATGTSATSGGNGICFGSSPYQIIYHNETSLYFNPSGGSVSSGCLTLNPLAFSPTTNGGCDLGTASNGWDNLFMSDQSYIMSGTKYIAYDAGTDLYIGAHNLTDAADFQEIQLMGQVGVILRASEADIGVELDASPGLNTSFHPVIGSKVSSLNLGSSTVGLRWGVVYCQSVSESSDVSLKSDIHYLDPPQVNLLSTADVQEEQYITVEDVLEFISELKPATFVYKSKNISTVADAEELDMEAIHLGIIANDIEDSKLFEYVASKHETTTTLEDGTTKVDKNLSIKPASLAVAALTACKYLINQVKELKEMLNNGNN